MSGFPVVTMPAITREDMVEVDRVMIEDLGIALVQMMENAGRNLADLAQAEFAPGSVTVFAGSGGNGGGGMAAARHLLNRGLEVVVRVTRDEPGGVPGLQLDALREMGCQVEGVEAPIGRTDLLVDALVGYSLDGDPRGAVAAAIDAIDASGLPVLSLDTPSGLDVTSGRLGTPCVTATATMTLAMPKVGLLESPDVVGTLFAADISVPASVYGRFGIEPAAWFADSPIVRIDQPEKSKESQMRSASASHTS